MYLLCRTLDIEKKIKYLYFLKEIFLEKQFSQNNYMLEKYSKIPLSAKILITDW